jgi:hypothetical protein
MTMDTPGKGYYIRMMSGNFSGMEVLTGWLADEDVKDTARKAMEGSAEGFSRLIKD